MLSVVTDQKYAPAFASWMREHMGQPFEFPDTHYVASVDDADGAFTILGCTALNKWTVGSCEAHACSDGSKRQKIDRHYIFTTFDYAFRHADKTCLITHVAVDNEKSLALQDLLGFSRIGVIPSYYGDGKDAVLFAITRSQWLNGKWGSFDAPQGA